jgi:hypothetical protein
MIRPPLRALAVVLLSIGCNDVPNGVVTSANSDAATDAIAEGGIDGSDGSTTRVRIMAANITSGSSQSYELPGLHIFQGLLPDIVMIQEFHYASGDQRAMVDAAFGAAFAFYAEPAVGGGIPNGIISRYPILQSGAWVDASVANRSFAYAKIDVPGPIDLWAISVHLLTSGPTQRSAEATQLLGLIQMNVPARDYVLVGGDFNTDVTNEQALLTLGAVVDISPPWPVDQAGNQNTSTNRNHPHDWLLAGPSLHAHATPMLLGAGSFKGGLVFDSRVYLPLSDVPPVVMGDSAAAGMQHMPVVREFLLPN